MSTVLTDFVLHLEPGTTEPSDELVEQTWDALRGFLAAEMKRRSCWANPPRFLGVVGHDRWTTTGATGDALDELCSECFEHIFLNRRSSLCEQARRKPNVDGLIALAIRQFLLDIQRRHDPLGFRLFEVLRLAVRRGVETERWVLVAGDQRIRNDSILARSGELAAENAQGFDAETLAGRWVSEYLDGLLTASHASLGRLVGQLADELETALDLGPGAFRFGDLAAVLKAHGRVGWAARFADSLFVAELYQLDKRHGVEPEVDESQKRFKRLTECVTTGIERLDTRTKTRHYLERLWDFLRALAIDRLDDAYDTTDGSLPSQRQLSRLLDIPRERITGLLGTLGEQLQDCRRSLDALPSEVFMATSDSPSAGRQAWNAVRLALDSTAWTPQSTHNLCRGDLVSLPDDDAGVAWLVLVLRADGQIQCAPADCCPLVGPDDLPVESTAGERWIVRQAFERRITRDRLVAGCRIGHVAPDHLAAVFADPTHLGVARVDSQLPSYVDWIDTGPAAAAHSLDAPAAAFHRPNRGPNRTPWSALLAALFAVAVLGLGTELARLGNELDRLRAPIIDLPYREIAFDPEMRGVRPISLPPEASHVQLVLVPPLDALADAYRVEIDDVVGEPIYRGPWREVNEISLTFSTPAVQNDPITVRLYSRIDDTETLLDTQQIEWIE